MSDRDAAIAKLIEAASTLSDGAAMLVEGYPGLSIGGVAKAIGTLRADAHMVNAAVTAARRAIAAPPPQESEREKRYRDALESAMHALRNVHDNASNQESYTRWMDSVDSAKEEIEAALSPTTSTAPAEISYTVSGAVSRGVQEAKAGGPSFAPAPISDGEIASLRADLAEACGLLKQWTATCYGCRLSDLSKVFIDRNAKGAA